MRQNISSAEKSYIADGIELNVRNDGRGRFDFRNFTLEVGIIPQATSSARVTLGETDVIVGVKVDIGAPLSSSPNRGQFLVSVECSPSTAASLDRKILDETNTSLARALERVITPCLNLEQLCLIAGSQVWIVYVDALVVGIDGNILDCISLATRAALCRTTFADVKVLTSEEGETEIQLTDDPDRAVPLDAARVPLCVSLVRIGGQYVVDPTAGEEACAGARITVAVSQTGELSLLKGGHGAVDAAQLTDMMFRGQQIGMGLLDQLGKLLRETK